MLVRCGFDAGANDDAECWAGMTGCGDARGAGMVRLSFEERQRWDGWLAGAPLVWIGHAGGAHLQGIPGIPGPFPSTFSAYIVPLFGTPKGCWALDFGEPRCTRHHPPDY